MEHLADIYSELICVIICFCRKLLSKNGRYLVAGDLLQNPELAKTLKNIQKHNITDFYDGKLAEQIVNDVNNAGGEKLSIILSTVLYCGLM